MSDKRTFRYALRGALICMLGAGFLLLGSTACSQSEKALEEEVSSLRTRITSLEQELATQQSASKGPAETIQTKRLEIVDNAGAARVVLSLEGGRPSVAMADGQGQVRAWLYLREDGSPNLALINNPRFILMDQNGEVRLLTGLEATGAPVLSQVDAQGEVRAALQLDAEGNATLNLFDSSGEKSFQAP